MINSKQCEMCGALKAVGDLKRILKKNELTAALIGVAAVERELLNNAKEITELNNDLDEAVKNYDRLLFALLATDEARESGMADDRPVLAISIDEALKVIESMRLKLREYQILDEIPFGSMEQEPEHE
ncbi:hypothetical protein [Pantoea sp. y20]